MESDSLHDTTVSIVDGDPGGSIEASRNDGVILEEISPNKEVMREIGNDLIRLGMDLACCSEKLVNMNLLMMHVAAKESDFEAFTLEKDNKLDSSAVAALEFDILSGFFDLEVKEMNNFIGNLKIKFKNSCDAISSYKHLEAGLLKLEEKLLDAEKSLKQSEEQVQELMIQSAKFQRIVLRANRGETSDEDRDMGVEENGEFFNSSTKLQMQTPEQQRHILKLLEKSMARELGLENQLTECMQTIDKMNRKLYYSQRELLSVEDETAVVYARFLEADNASAVLMGISKELIGQLQSCQLNINSALCRESELNTKLQNCMQTIQKLEKEEAISQELAEKNSLEAMVLKEKLNSLEEQLKTSELALSNGHGNLQVEVKALEEKVAISESRAEKAEADSKLLSITNKELIEEMDLLKHSGVSREKIDLLEEQLREKDIQLQQAMVSIESSQEEKSSEAMVLKEKLNSLEEQLKTSELALLNGSVSLNQGNMQHEVKALEEKVVIAESRAEKAEAESKLLSITNKELMEEIDLLKRSAISCEKIDALEEQLKEKDCQLQQAMVSIEASQEKQSMYYTSIQDMEIVIEKLKTNLSSAESRADMAESECILLVEANKELNMELDLVKVNSIPNEKVVSLENKLQDTDIQLQQAAASVEASQEKQSMLVSSINDMEILIEKMKSKVLKADARADSAEDKCIILSESHAELNEELNFLRGKVERLEATLQQTEEKKLAAAKDINIRTKVITDLVMQLALEREQLQKQISWLTEDNRAWKDKLKMASKLSRGSMNHVTREPEEEDLFSANHARSFDSGIGESDIPSTAESLQDSMDKA
ncbi:WPP domain-interacting tail-anchored protein 1 isoform X2 [Silene latifolia]|uniref:WPP domain-interacting tail-anchored protein 1 isoform X2 n=1 Tax=Silene latifolia TaxID=37657 RepID=UPI003D7813B4